MFELLKFANEKNINIEIKTLDGSYRPSVGEIISVVTFSKGNNPSNSSQIIILKTDSEDVIKGKMNKAIESLFTKEGKTMSYADILRERERFFYGL